MPLTVENVTVVLPSDPYGMGYVWMDTCGCMISPEDFVTRFDGAELTYDSLYNHSAATTGWKNQFDAWKAASILS